MVRIPIKNKDSIPLDIPDKPGIYLFYDKNKEIIYVGKANSLKKRLYQYRTHSRKKNHRKMRRIIEVACGLDWQILGGPEEALLAENNIIQTKKPKEWIPATVKEVTTNYLNKVRVSVIYLKKGKII